jgi:hypothetical protein
MTGRARAASIAIAILCCVVGQIAAAGSVASERSSEAHESSLTSPHPHQGSAIVPANALVRSGRAIGQLVGAPLAGVLACVGLLALWLTRSVRRRELLAHSVVTYRRRGPPYLPSVG